MDDFVPALLKEIVLQKDYLNREKVNSIYFGGGTPSMLKTGDIEKIIDGVDTHFNIVEDAEITLEANPDDLDKSKLEELSSTAINRLSIGIQSFEEHHLKMMNRSHNALEATNCVQLAQNAGFDNVSIDLIYGIPGLSDDDWRQALDTAQRLNVQHLSTYALTVETGTKLFQEIKKKKISAPKGENAAKHFAILQEMALDKEWDHYEISNLSLKGKRSRHNSSYWKNASYLGLGPSAHSYNGSSRQWNVANIKQYIDAIDRNAPMFEKEHLSLVERCNEFIMTSLRTKEGLDLEVLENKFPSYFEAIVKDAKRMDATLIELGNNAFTLTARGKFFADGLASELFRDS